MSERGGIRFGRGLLVRKREDGTEDTTVYDEQRRKNVGTRAAQFRLGPGILNAHKGEAGHKQEAPAPPPAPEVPRPRRQPAGLGKGKRSGKPSPMSEG